MKDISIEDYNNDLSKAVSHFWNTRNSQLTGRTKADQGNRSAVTGGKRLPSQGFTQSETLTT
jgi:hypothetical protein